MASLHDYFNSFIVVFTTALLLYFLSECIHLQLTDVKSFTLHPKLFKTSNIYACLSLHFKSAFYSEIQTLLFYIKIHQCLNLIIHIAPKIFLNNKYICFNLHFLLNFVFCREIQTLVSIENTIKPFLHCLQTIIP